MTQGIPDSPQANTNDLQVTESLRHRHIWVIAGPTGCGKTSIASYLSRAFSLPHLEGDTYHPKANVDKMAVGTPLTDADRWDWLILLRQQCMAAFAADVPGVFLSCSALKRKYRDVLRMASYNDFNVLVHFIHLYAPMDILLQRVHDRVGHYMKDAMVKSQFEALEPPSEDENDVFAVNANAHVDRVRTDTLSVVTSVLANDRLPSSPGSQQQHIESLVGYKHTRAW